MSGIPSDLVLPLAQLVGVGILGILAAFGIWWGQRRTPSSDRTMEVAGALVDSKSVMALAAAIEAQTMERITARKDAEKTRKLGYELRDTLDDFIKELQEIRREMRELGNAIMKH